MPLIQGTGVADVDVEGPGTAVDAEVEVAVEAAEDEVPAARRILLTESMLAIRRATLQPKSGKRLEVQIGHLSWKCAIVRRVEAPEAEDAVEAKVEEITTMLIHQ
jgi:hypothetical protein